MAALLFVHDVDQPPPPCAPPPRPDGSGGAGGRGPESVALRENDCQAPTTRPNRSDGFFVCHPSPPHQMLRLAIPNKGRLHDEARSLLADAGLEVRASSERALVASLGGEFEAIFVRAQDIPEFVADGAADAGITGWDLVSESGRSLESRLDLGSVSYTHLTLPTN